jgi:hypothetical protein
VTRAALRSYKDFVEGFDTFMGATKANGCAAPPWQRAVQPARPLTRARSARRR